MNTAVQAPTITGASFPAAHPMRSILRSTGMLLAALTLTAAVLVVLASVVDTWA